MQMESISHGLAHSSDCHTFGYVVPGPKLGPILLYLALLYVYIYMKKSYYFVKILVLPNVSKHAQVPVHPNSRIFCECIPCVGLLFDYSTVCIFILASFLCTNQVLCYYLADYHLVNMFVMFMLIICTFMCSSTAVLLICFARIMLKTKFFRNNDKRTLNVNNNNSLFR